MICGACLKNEATGRWAVTIERLDVADDTLGPSRVHTQAGRLEPRYRWECWIVNLCTSCNAVLDAHDRDGQKGVKLKDRPERWYAGHRVGSFANTTMPDLFDPANPQHS